jgi:hypothetical protein
MFGLTCSQQRIEGLVGCRRSPSESSKTGQVGGNDGTSPSAAIGRVTDGRVGRAHRPLGAFSGHVRDRDPIMDFANLQKRLMRSI